MKSPWFGKFVRGAPPAPIKIMGGIKLKGGSFKFLVQAEVLTKKAWKKIDRYDLCPCGSGKKFQFCCCLKKQESSLWNKMRKEFIYKLKKEDEKNNPKVIIKRKIKKK